MRTMTSVLAAFCVLIGSAVQAQEADRTPPTAPEPAHQTMLLTGCLSAGPDATTFTLTRATAIEPGPTGVPRAVATSGAHTEYQLKAEARLDKASVSPVDMKAFVGQQVEVTTRPVVGTPPSSDQQHAAGAPTVAPDPGKPIEKKVERLAVTTIKQLAASCK